MGNALDLMQGIVPNYKGGERPSYCKNTPMRKRVSKSGMTFEKAEQMRATHKDRPELTLTELGKLFGAGIQAAWGIVNHKTWVK